ncbi:AAA family ATPase [Hyphomicrobium sp. DY-1]|uniref:AAA family ATPase n=1 Tax=Hyphomicrobium sp. DY-1 TaxID=3075650 RepID=UPI0039C44026
MDIRVLGWSYENIRGGLREVEIDLGSPLPRWTLIQMPNGTGKTTTMALLRAVFTGEALSPNTVREFRASDNAETGQFEVRLTIDERLYRIQLRLDYRTGGHAYWTARSEERSGGIEEGLLLPRELVRLLTPEFARLFIFDGELAKEIRAVGKERAAEAIKTLYRLDQLEKLKVQVGRLVDERQQAAASVTSATELRGVSRWRNAAKAAEARKMQLLTEQREYQRHLRELGQRQAAIATTIQEHIQQNASLRARKEALDQMRGQIDKELFEATSRGMALLRSPPKVHPRILARLHALGGKLTSLKLPKTISSEFFRELAEQNECVCGRPISQIEKKAVLDRANLYLAEDQIAVINKMKLALRESSADDSEFSTVANSLRGKLRELQQNKRDHDQLELDQIESGDSEVEALRTEAQRIESELKEMELAAERVATRDPSRQRVLRADTNNNIALCEAELKRCQEKYATVTKTRRFMDQAERLQELVGKIADLALDRLRERVRKATNEKLLRFIPSESLQVARIGGALELESTRLASKADVSEGQSLSVAYAFLTSLLTEAPYQLPFIVDSPAVSLDTKVRREVGELIPNLFGQMIMFVISSEREGFADAFYARQSVRFLTLWRETDEVTQVRDGLAFFRAFHAPEAVV